MKKTLYLLVTTVLLLSCGNDELLPKREDGSKEITFTLDNLEELQEPIVSTRSTVSEAGCTDLWVWEGTTLLGHQTSTDSNFGSPTINLTYGTHQLTFVASESNGQSWKAGVWSTTKVIGDYAVCKEISVSGNSENNQSVQLSRRNSRVKFQTQDNIPENVDSCHLKIHNYKSLDKDLIAGPEYIHEARLCITGYHGKTYSVFVNTLTLSPTDEEDCSVTIEFLNSSGIVLYSYDRTVKLKSGRCVTLTGNYFSGGTSNISISSTDFEETTQQLFE